MSEIIKDDVLEVAEYMHMKPTEEQIQFCIDEFDRRADEDPTGSLQIWIEDLLLEQKVETLPTPPEKHQYFLFEQTTGEVELDLGMLTQDEAENYESGSLRVINEHQLLVEQSLVSIQKDVRDGDLTVIEGLLQSLSKKTLKDFLALD